MSVIKFCPKCRRAIKIPIQGVDNISVLGEITVECGHVTRFQGGKEVRCTGKIIIKPKKQKENGGEILG